MALSDQEKAWLKGELLDRFERKNTIDVLLLIHFAMAVKSAPDPDLHPIRRAFWHSYVTRLAKYLQTPPEKRTLEATIELEDISRWMFRRERVWSEEHEVFVGNFATNPPTSLTEFRAQPFDYASVRRLISKVQTTFRPSGPPRQHVAMTLDALEMKMNFELTWEQVTQKVCDCGKESGHHNLFCLANLKRQVAFLRAFIKKHDLKSDHPHREVKVAP